MHNLLKTVSTPTPKNGEKAGFGSAYAPFTPGGRSPKINNNGGRDHWGGIVPLVLAGGGLKMGQVVGQSSRDGGVPATEPIRIRVLMATITHTVFDVGQMRLQAGLPPEILQLTENGRPIEQLF